MQPQAPQRGTSVSPKAKATVLWPQERGLSYLGAFRRSQGTPLPHQVTWWSWGRDPVLGGSCLWGRC